MAFKQFDTVTALEDLPAFGVRTGMLGTVVDVYSDGSVEVEFFDVSWTTVAIAPVRSTQIQLRALEKKAA